MRLTRSFALAVALCVLAAPATAQAPEEMTPSERHIRTRGFHAGIGLAGSSFKAHTHYDTRVGAGIVARLAYGVTPRLMPYLEGEAILLAMGGDILSHVDAGLRMHVGPSGILPAPYIDVSLTATEAWDDPAEKSGMNSVSLGGGMLLPIFAPLAPDLGAKLTFGQYDWLDSVRIRIGASWSPRGRR